MATGPRRCDGVHRLILRAAASGPAAGAGGTLGPVRIAVGSDEDTPLVAAVVRHLEAATIAGVE